MSRKLWDGRFQEKTDRLIESFTASIDFDKRLYKHDIEGSIAHARMLAETGVISMDEASRIIEGLGIIRREIERGEFAFDTGLEDIHMHIEARLIQLIGKTAQKLHTARSRNDQIALDMRLFLKEETDIVIKSLRELRRVLVEKAQDCMDVIMPGYTHMQRAQPVLFSHHLMAYYEMFTRDRDRFESCCRRIDSMPLGAAALAGTTFPIDRGFTAELLGFSGLCSNSIDAVSDRDFVMEFLACACILMVHLSRFSEELILWSSSEFDFIELPDSFATGSSIMPQKKNPDVAELVRGKTGRVIGDLVSTLTMMKGLPLSYNRDMQEDKEPLFDAVDTICACLAIYTRMLPRVRVKKERMEKAASSGYLNATDMADYLVGKGMPFREAHHHAGKAVAYAIEKKKELHELTMEELKNISGLFERDIYEFLDINRMIERRNCEGATAGSRVASAINSAFKALASEEEEKA